MGKAVGVESYSIEIHIFSYEKVGEFYIYSLKNCWVENPTILKGE